MIHLYAEMVRGLLLILAAIRAQTMDARREVVDQALVNTLREYTQDHPDDPLTQWLSSIPWYDTLAQINYDELIGSLKDQLDNQGSGKGYVTLLETVIDIIGGPWGSNRLGGEILSALRRAIMRPSEIETFRKVSRESFQCDRCEHRFTNAEAIVVMRESNNNLSVRCMQCAAPSYGVCAKCGDAAPLTDAGRTEIQAAVQKVTCDCTTHHNKKSVDVPGPAPDQPIPRRNARERAAQLLARGQFRGIGDAAQPRIPAPARLNINGPVDAGLVGHLDGGGWVEQVFVDNRQEGGRQAEAGPAPRRPHPDLMRFAIHLDEVEE